MFIMCLFSTGNWQFLRCVYVSDYNLPGAAANHPAVAGISGSE